MMVQEEKYASDVFIIIKKKVQKSCSLFDAICGVILKPFSKHSVYCDCK